MSDNVLDVVNALDFIECLDKMIRVWRFCDAPESLRSLSKSGDEDWLALIPPHLNYDYIGWMQEPFFGCAGVDEYELPGGWIVRIGCHA